jgi:adenylate cyclase
VLLSGGRVRVTAQLVDARTDRHLWAHAYDGEAQDVLALQNNVVQAIANEIQIKIKPQEQARLAAPRRVDPEVFRELVRERILALQLRQSIFKCDQHIESSVYLERG